jgi:periplasmic protein TonB
MSADLFVADARQYGTRSRRSSLVLASVAVHAAVVSGILAAPMLLPGVLPIPPGMALAWEHPRLVRLTDIPLPARHILQPPHEAGLANPFAPVADMPIDDAPVAPDRSATPSSGCGGDCGAIAGISADLGFVPGAVLDPPAPPVATPRSAPVRLHAGMTPPQKVRDVMPAYPALARSAGAYGVVIIEATVDVNGQVTSAKVLRSVPLLDDAALDAVRQWRYTPARLNGEPVAVLITVTVNFTLASR